MIDTINISGKKLAIIVIVLLLLSGTFAGFFIGHSKSNQDSPSNSQPQYQNMPEKCRLPVGQDVNSWKEHLGHHEDTKDCLKYFN